jgi:hypothetical protein
MAVLLPSFIVLHHFDTRVMAGGEGKFAVAGNQLRVQGFCQVAIPQQQKRQERSSCISLGAYRNCGRFWQIDGLAPR